MLSHSKWGGFCAFQAFCAWGCTSSTKGGSLVWLLLGVQSWILVSSLLCILNWYFFIVPHNLLSNTPLGWKRILGYVGMGLEYLEVNCMNLVFYTRFKGRWLVKREHSVASLECAWLSGLSKFSSTWWSDHLHPNWMSFCGSSILDNLFTYLLPCAFLSFAFWLSSSISKWDVLVVLVFM